jgi:anti-sigma B factor antagonist
VRSGEVALDRSEEGLTVVTTTGEHDLSTAPALRSQLDQLIGDGDPIVVDLSEATFIDSSILGTVLQGHRDAAEKGVGFAVAHADGADAVRRVLEITGLKQELPVYSSREEALARARDGHETGR